MPHLILVDLTSAARYAEGHIPGALCRPQAHPTRPAASPGLLPNKADLEKLFGELGHTRCGLRGL
jgi:thiosulfate/3-mercaptopyruvate sulfurtransferase